MIKDFRVDENFWDRHPEFKVMEPFKSLYKSQGKERSSRIMWGIALCYDYESRLMGLEERERLEIAENDVWGFRLDEGILSALKEKYLFLQRDSLRRYLYEWDLKLDERREFIKSLSYNEENWDKLDKMLLSTEKLLLQREAIKNMVESRESEDFRGKINPSLLERNEI
jgi:hypothetical protein